MTAEAMEGPIERTQQPRHAVLVGGPGGAAPLVRGVKEPYAGEAQRLRDAGNLPPIGRPRAAEPAPRDCIKRWDQRHRGARKESETCIAQCPRGRRIALGVTDGTAVA